LLQGDDNDELMMMMMKVGSKAPRGQKNSLDLGFGLETKDSLSLLVLMNKSSEF